MAGFVRMTVSHAGYLLERESELAELAGEIAAARTGAGRLLLVEGPAGIGKTELLTAARALAEEAGLVVASARGSELERVPDPVEHHEIVAGALHLGEPQPHATIIAAGAPFKARGCRMPRPGRKRRAGRWTAPPAGAS